LTVNRADYHSVNPAVFTDASPGRLAPTFGGVVAFVPEPVPRTLDLDLATIRLIERAQHRIGALGGATRRLVNPYLLAAPLLRQEAILSSRIEGTITTPEQLALLELGAPPREEDTREVGNFVRATQHALDALATTPVTLRLIRDTHRILMTGVRGDRERPGELRDAQNFIGTSLDIREARFVPPPHTELPRLLGDLERFLNEEEPELPLLVRIALAHYQFEAIHPFRDGNGRIGRLLIVLLLVREGALPAPLLPISSYLERHRERYMNLLFAVSARGAWLEWIRFFLEAVAESAERAAEQVEGLLELRGRWHARFQAARSSALLLKLVDALFQTPGVTIAQAAALLGVTPAAATANVAKLVEAGILREITGRKRDRIFLAREILTFMSAGEPAPGASPAAQA
jgi:Fic family protein